MSDDEAPDQAQDDTAPEDTGGQEPSAEALWLRHPAPLRVALGLEAAADDRVALETEAAL